MFFHLFFYPFSLGVIALGCFALLYKEEWLLLAVAIVVFALMAGMTVTTITNYIGYLPTC